VIRQLRRLAAALLITALIGLLAGGDMVSEVRRPSLSAAAQLRVVALGDSVTSGRNCGCAPFPDIYGDLLHARTDAPVTVENLGAAGLDSTGLLSRLDQPNSPTELATASADVVLLTIGANDFGDHHDDITSGRCTGTECVSAELGQLTTNLDRILDRIHALRDGQPTTILVTGYWTVFQDGQVARRSFPTSGRAATTRLTRRVNTVIASTARSARAVYVDLYGPFESVEVTNLLAPDGDHPNAAGHALIARLLLAATPANLTAH
jgi:lysophospholipase L1-like esterase